MEIIEGRKEERNEGCQINDYRLYCTLSLTSPVPGKYSPNL
jgi:hypothetical protein